MTDLSDYVPLSERASVPKPGDLLTDADVLKILNTLPDQMYRTYLIRHMLEAERAAFCQGIAEGKKQTGILTKEDFLEAAACVQQVTDGLRNLMKVSNRRRTVYEFICKSSALDTLANNLRMASQVAEARLLDQDKVPLLITPEVIARAIDAWESKLGVMLLHRNKEEAMQAALETILPKGDDK